MLFNFAAGVLLPLYAREGRRLAAIAQQLNTTSAMLLHLAFALVAARLQPESRREDGSVVALTCHVVTGREQHASRMQHVVGALDTSLPVCVEAAPGDSLRLEMLRSSDPELGSKAKALMSRDGFVRIPTARAAWGSSEAEAEAARCGRRSSRMR